jgi:flagellar protein FlaI
MAKRGGGKARASRKAHKSRKIPPSVLPFLRVRRRFRGAARREAEAQEVEERAGERAAERFARSFKEAAATMERPHLAEIKPKELLRPAKAALPPKAAAAAGQPAPLPLATFQRAPPAFAKTLEKYRFTAAGIAVDITIGTVAGEYVPIYYLSIPLISPATMLVLERIRTELIKTVELGMMDITDPKRGKEAEQKFAEAIAQLIRKYFPDAGEETVSVLVAYLMQKTLGLGDLETLMNDRNLEEIAVNNSDDPVWVYHRKWGWLKTTVRLRDEEQIRNYAAMIGRKVGRQINVLDPLMDANLRTGDRVNATLTPISIRGNTITLRKFASKPWTITDIIQTQTTSVEAAALLWEAIQYELSILVAGGTATGKTSFLNALSNFFPPNQRIISIEDTRELQLASFLHWLPMITRLPGPEGRGAITMLDLLVNSLRMRPDRIIVGEIRRQAEAEVLFEAIHTGHSVYATVHANNAQETYTRLTSPPINVPSSMLPALNLIVVQYRNRRSGIRRTFQIAEILDDGSPNVLLQYDPRRNRMRPVSKSRSLTKNLQLYAGITPRELRSHLKEKERILKWLVKKNINSVDEVGKVMAQYYTEPKKLLAMIRS